MFSRFNVVLFKPEIASNTGNIGRLCLGAGAKLIIVKPTKFLLTDKQIRRAGLDYWKDVKPRFVSSLKEIDTARAYYCTTKSKKPYYECFFAPDDYFVFGPESSGLPKDLLAKNAERTITIPMTKSVRSLNLANSVAIILHEALRQNGHDK